MGERRARENDRASLCMQLTAAHHADEGDRRLGAPAACAVASDEHYAKAEGNLIVACKVIV